MGEGRKDCRKAGDENEELNLEEYREKQRSDYFSKSYIFECVGTRICIPIRDVGI